MKIGTFYLNKLGLHNFKLFIKNTTWKNRISIVLFLLNIKEKITYINYEFKGDSKRQLLRHLLGLEQMNKIDSIRLICYLSSIFNNKKYITFDNFKFKYLQPILFKEVFMNEDYKIKFTLNNDVLLDIGANVGDTALYFANKGYNVKSFEPISDNFNKLEENIKLNPELAKNIEIFNYAVSVYDDKKKIYIHETDSGSCSSRIKSKFFEIADAITFNKLIEKYNPKVIKMDCEGDEENLIFHGNLDNVEELFVEIHTHLGVSKKNIKSYLMNKGFLIEEKFNILHCIRSEKYVY